MSGFLSGRTSLTTVQTADIADNAIGLAQLAHQADGSILTFGTDTAPTLLAPDTSGEVLTTKGAGALPAFDAAASGALTFISNTDISAAATYDFTAFTAGSYEHYIFYLQNVIPVTDDVHMWVRTSTDGGSSYDAGASDYNWGGMSGRHTEDLDSADSRFAATGDEASIQSTLGSTSTESGASGIIYLYGPHTTSYTQLQSILTFVAASNQMVTCNMGGVRQSAGDVDGFRILFESGNIESGTITAYGLANA